MEEPMSKLTHDLVAEILSRVPYKSLCICKCVCPAWRGIIADPANRKKMAQTLAGFFYRINNEATAEPRGFDGVKYADMSAFPWSIVPETHPRLPLPPDSTDCFCSLEDSCDGLFLASIRTDTPAGNSRYMVSNPATSEYIVLPHSGYSGNISSAYLGFDSGVSTQEFHVFELVTDILPPDSQGIHPLVVTGVRIYSSKTGAWVAMEPKWDIQVGLCFGQTGVFHKGCLHVLTDESGLAIVDAEGLKWRTVLLPILAVKGFSGFIGKSAGRLLYIDSCDREGFVSRRALTLSAYVLSSEVYNWDASHHQNDECMYWKLYRFPDAVPGKMFLKVIGVHPHANLIFIHHSNNELLAYDLDHRERPIVYRLDHNYQRFMQFFPYVPLLSCLPLDGGIRLATPN
ncbi:hypothetical protein CFC21_111233 [Triticum aestivum]|uniref:F-box domain-containing protein n=2 Tax=Triticum aestivum TaxID=4565 RepID=A0A3B6TL40_WHEAT|nr:hypothetical protein CFC21_111233 [Triticum aestivum]